MSNTYKLILVVVFTVVGTYAQDSRKLKLKPQKFFLKTPVEANLVTPTGVAVNSKGHVFAVNAGTNKLMEFDEEGNFVRALAQGLLVGPHGLRIDREDNIWVTDLELHIVLKIDPKGKLLMVVGQKGTNGEFDEERKMALFYKPADIAFGNNDEIYIADGYGNSRIVKLDKSGNYIKAWGKKGTAEGEFDNPHNIVVDANGLVYVADRNNKRIQIFNSEGVFQKSWTHLGTPWGLVLTDDQELYMTDGTNEKILKLDLNGKILGEYGKPGSQNGSLRGAHAICLDASKNIYVTEVFNWRIQKFNQSHR